MKTADELFDGSRAHLLEDCHNPYLEKEEVMIAKKQIEFSENRHLDCVLTDEEVKQYGEDLAHRLMDISALELKRARVNAKIKPIQQDVEQLVTKIGTKIEVREVVCDWHYDWDRRKKKLIRTDTFEEVRNTTFDITDDERQCHFEGMEP